MLTKGLDQFSGVRPNLIAATSEVCGEGVLKMPTKGELMIIRYGGPEFKQESSMDTKHRRFFSTKTSGVTGRLPIQ
jgi:hypothetical protein